jgi:glycosyltransferase involved in cell wall biosynthesis
MPKVSVIIPIYKVEEYLSDCIRSIIEQSFQDLEIICVNDASPDNCKHILSEFSEKENRIKVISHDINKGLGPSRNTGLNNATSEFIAFIDSDDFISPRMIEKLFDAIKTADADLAWCGTTYISEGDSSIQSDPIPGGVWSVQQMLNEEKLYPSILSMCNKMYKREYLLGIDQLPIISEDQPALAKYFTRIERIVTIPDPLYFYRKRKGTLSSPSVNYLRVWNDYFYSHNLFIQILLQRFNDLDILRKQVILRHFSILWRIIALGLLYTESWKEQEKYLIKILQSDEMGLKKANPVMHLYLLIILKYIPGKRVKEFLMKIGLKLSRNSWIKSSSYILLPFYFIKMTSPFIKSKIIAVLNSIELYSLSFVAYVIRSISPGEKIWIIGERPTTAGENGFSFYKYLKYNHEEIKSFYVIDFTCPQFLIVKKFGDIVNFKSYRYKILFLACDCFITSHNSLLYPEYAFGTRKMKLNSRTKNIFLQHGITQADVSIYYGKTTGKFSLFVCGALPEYNYVLHNFGYESSQVKYTGFSRFDELHDFSTKKQILLMPTWRRELYNISSTDQQKGDEIFRNSEYFIHYQSLLNNNRLIRVLEENKIDLLFFPHFEIQRFIHNFKCNSQNIKVISNDKILVRDILKESRLLITDTSSVSFDFAYMHKPVIYYQFDTLIYSLLHLKGGYFNFESMGFGKVVHNEADLIIALLASIGQGFVIEQIYLERVKDFFPIYDSENSDRIFSEIQKLR